MKTRVVGAFAADFESALTAVFEDDVVKAETHDMSSVAINGSGGAFVAFGSGAALSAAVKALQITYTAGEPIAFRVAADAAAAAALSNDLFVINQGDGPVMVKVKIAAGGKIWVRSKSTNSISSGYITANLQG